MAISELARPEVPSLAKFTYLSRSTLVSALLSFFVLMFKGSFGSTVMSLLQPNASHSHSSLSLISLSISTPRPHFLSASTGVDWLLVPHSFYFPLLFPKPFFASSLCDENHSQIIAPSSTVYGVGTLLVLVSIIMPFVFSPKAKCTI